jgi:hypothetical protein
LRWTGRWHIRPFLGVRLCHRHSSYGCSLCCLRVVSGNRCRMRVEVHWSRGECTTSPRNGGTIICHMASCQPDGRYFGVNGKRDVQTAASSMLGMSYSMSTVTAIRHQTRATQRCTHGTQVRHRIPKKQNPHPADGACSRIRVAHPEA